MNTPFWSAYRSAVKDNLLPLVDLPKNNEVFALPFTVPFTNATAPLTNEDVNYLIYNLANTTLAADGTTGNYAQELNTYLNTVDKASIQDPEAKKRLEEAETALKLAHESFTQTETEAKAQYNEVPPPRPPFEQWALMNWPPYTAAKRILASTTTQRNTAYNAYWARTRTLEGYLANLTKALDAKTLYQWFNMSVRKDGKSTFAPHYSSLGLKDQLNDWIKGLGQRHTFVEIKIDSATPSGAKADSGIYLKLTTMGVAKFDINVGQWNVENIRALYPKRVPGAPDVLNPKYARPLSYLVAYAPKLEVEIRESGKIMSTSPATTTAADDQPYATILGVLGQHFPGK